MPNITIRLPDDNPRVELLAAKGGVFIPATNSEIAQIRDAIGALVDFAQGDPVVSAKGELLMGFLNMAIAAPAPGGTA